MSIPTKMGNFNIMNNRKDLHPYLPATVPFSIETMWDFISQYGEVIIKPSVSRWGKNIYRLSHVENEKYEVQIENSTITIDGKDETTKYFSTKIGNIAYMIQRHIPLAKINGRPFDIRVMVQRRKESYLWVVTAMIAKVAGDGYIVTNLREGRTLLHVYDAIQQSTLNIDDIDALISEMNSVVIMGAEQLAKTYPLPRIYGFDMAIDIHGRIGIIEGNLEPALSHFSKLADKKMYNTIVKFLNE
nr:YheC/YheD family protein [Texcoconibacillus texcoconensis]